MAIPAGGQNLQGTFLREGITELISRSSKRFLTPLFSPAHCISGLCISRVAADSDLGSLPGALSPPIVQ